MKYKVEFENNQPVRAAIAQALADNEQRVAFELNEGKTIIKHLYLEAESKENAIQQARQIIETIFKF
jgi:hypothetical protein